MFSRMRTKKSTVDCSKRIRRLKAALDEAEAVFIGAGAGLSVSVGFEYSGERFEKYFGDFAETFHFRDMYSGGFYPYETLEKYWAYWSRYIYINRYMDAPVPVYDRLYELISEKDYFVLTTNVDHCFQKAGFDKHKLFYTQGDYGLFQCSSPCHPMTYENKDVVREMVEAQGYVIDGNNRLILPEGITPKMEVPTELVPYCPKCGEPMSMNLRADNTFVEDEGWHAAAGRYHDFNRRHKGLRVIFLELGVGGNTPGIIKYPFWQMTAENPKALYACINYGEAGCPKQIESQSLCIDGDIGTILEKCVFDDFI